MAKIQSLRQVTQAQPYTWSIHWKTEKDRKVTNLVEEVGIYNSTLYRAWMVFQTTKTDVRRLISCQTRKTTVSENRCIYYCKRRDQKQTAVEHIMHLKHTTQCPLSLSTFFRRLHEYNLFAFRQSIVYGVQQ